MVSDMMKKSEMNGLILKIQEMNMVWEVVKNGKRNKSEPGLGYDEEIGKMNKLVSKRQKMNLVWDVKKK